MVVSCQIRLASYSRTTHVPARWPFAPLLLVGEAEDAQTAAGMGEEVREGGEGEPLCAQRNRPGVFC